MDGPESGESMPSSSVRTISLLALLAAFPPLSTDMYLPALPVLQKTWNQPLVTINLTLIAFFISYCFFMLIYGPVSDRLGRRPPLLLGIGLYIAASLACALADGVWVLIVCRVIQAAGAASASTLALAITSDLFQGERRAKMFSYISIMMALAPMLAPIIGGWIMTILSWRFAFVAQAIMGAISWCGVLRMKESLESPNDEKLTKALSSYWRLFKNTRFFKLNTALALFSLPLFAFIAGSTDIYITHFGLSQTTFGYFFGFNALASMCGAFFFSRIAGRIVDHKILTICFLGVLLAGVHMTFSQKAVPWDLALPMWVVGFFLGLSRPPGMNLIMEQVDRDRGAASSMIVFSFMMIGTVGMWLISLDWTDKIQIIGILALATGTLNMAFWLGSKSKYVKRQA